MPFFFFHLYFKQYTKIIDFIYTFKRNAFKWTKSPFCTKKLQLSHLRQRASLKHSLVVEILLGHTQNTRLLINFVNQKFKHWNFWKGSAWPHHDRSKPWAMARNLSRSCLGVSTQTGRGLCVNKSRSFVSLMKMRRFYCWRFFLFKITTHEFKKKKIWDTCLRKIILIFKILFVKTQSFVFKILN